MQTHLLGIVVLGVIAAGSGLAQTPPTSQPSWQSDQINPVVRTESNRAVSLTVPNATLSRRYGKLTAPAGRAFLILATEWTNHIALIHSKGKDAATAYTVKDLRDNAYLVADGQVVWQLAAQTDYAPGVLVRRSFTVERPGEILKGNLVFDVPAGATPASLSFRFYDFAHGHMTLELVGTLAALPAALSSQKNDVIEAGVYDVRQADQFNGVQAPSGLAFLVVDLRARSTVTAEADASAFDPHAEPGAKIRIGTVADWKESRKYLQVIVDGEYAWPALSQTEIPAEPRFLPDLFTGGKAVFLVPQQHVSLELRCDFPNARLTDGKVVRPAGMTLPLAGKRPEPPQRKSIATVKDAIFDVAVVEQAIAGEFAGTQAAAGKKFLVIDVTVKNQSPQQEFFQTVEQLKHLDERGAASAVDKVTFTGLRRPLELIYIPGGEQRAFQLVYQVAAAETKPRLGYTSVTQGGSKALDLTAISEVPPTGVGTPATSRPAINQTPSVARPQTPVTPVTARQDRTPRGLEGVGLTTSAVSTAIDRGSKALWEHIRTEDLKAKGAKLGDKPEHILAALALVHAGAHKKIPEFHAALCDYLKAVQPRKLRTYDIGLFAMLLEAYGDAEFGPKLEESARHLLESQGPRGTWNYTAFLPDDLYKKPVEFKTGRPVGAEKAPILLTRKSTQRANSDGDNSNTQYAILGLNAASRAGIKVSPDVWRLILQTTFARQENSGGWSYYEKGGTAYGSMTAAGICAVALCRHELGEADPTKDEAIENGLGWLVANFSIAQHPQNTIWQYYYIYSIERLGRILDTEFIGPHEWYPEGALHLLGQQKDSGLWIGKAQEADARLASSFALLFLTRATPSLNLKRDLHSPSTAPIATTLPSEHVPQVAKPREGLLRTAALPPFRNYYLMLDASASMLEELDGKVKFDVARDSIRAIVNDLPANSNVALRVFGHRKAASEDNADQDTELVIPMAPLNKQKFTAVIDALRPRGKTPLALSIEEAAKDLGKTNPLDPVVVMLLADGGDDTQPRRDPLQSADLLNNVKGIRFHVVGVGMHQPELSELLLGMAQRGGGQYWPAARGADLKHRIRTRVLGLPGQYVVIDSGGKEAPPASFGQPATLAEGKYRLRALFAGSAVEHNFSISAGSITSLVFDGPQAIVISGGGTIPPATRPMPGPSR